LFKLLIIDDEDNTREGIAERINWNEIGIGHIEQSDDGVNALKKATDFKPDIILTDVRMPRMDGIELSFKLRELYPDCVIIFMSGYADKVYLKSAIQLKAVSYLEKPINLNELSQAVKDAVDMCQEVQKKKETEASLTSSLSLLENELSLLLIQRKIELSLIEQHMKTARLKLPFDGVFLTILVRIFPYDSTHSKAATNIMNIFNQALEKVRSEKGVCSISASKDSHNIIIHLYSDVKANHLFTSEKLQNICGQIVSPLEGSYKYFLSIGKKVFGVLNIHESYETAVITMRKAFFEGYNCIISFNENSNCSFFFEPKLFQDFTAIIEKQSREQAIFFIKQISSDLKRFINTPVNSIKDFCFRLLLDLCKISEKLGITLINDLSGKKHIWEFFFKINTLDELGESLIYYVNTYYNMVEAQNSNNRVINIVKNYIKENYQDESLSITKISDHIHMAPTYLCSLFKEKTSKTLNQYITEVRIDKSKELLLSNNYKISDISSMIGFRDQGYFAKLFRKITGMTPSEYILRK